METRKQNVISAKMKTKAEPVRFVITGERKQCMIILPKLCIIESRSLKY